MNDILTAQFENSFKQKVLYIIQFVFSIFFFLRHQRSMEEEFKYDQIINLYKKLASSCPELVKNQKKWKQIKIPTVSATIMKQLILDAKEAFQNEPMVINVKSPINIVGDLHGHLFDLLRILDDNGFPDNGRYLFLGDIIDRGEFNVETLTLILLIKVMYPNDVYLIRGNHEFEQIVDHSSIKNELISMYPEEDFYDQIFDMFGYVSLGAIVDNDCALCVHGGICSNFLFVNQLNEIKKPVHNIEENQVVLGCVWSDPKATTDTYGPSDRGMGETFGTTPLQTFLQKNNLFVMVRGHQVVEGGVEFGLSHRIATVFSASSYCGENQNKAGILQFVSDSRYEPKTYDSLPYVKRSSIVLQPTEKLLTPKATAKIQGYTSASSIPPPLPLSSPAQSTRTCALSSVSARIPAAARPVKKNVLPPLMLNNRPGSLPTKFSYPSNSNPVSNRGYPKKRNSSVIPALNPLKPGSPARKAFTSREIGSPPGPFNRRWNA